MPGPGYLLLRAPQSHDSAQYHFLAQEIHLYDLNAKASLAQTLHNTAMQKLSAALLMLRPELSKASQERISTLIQEALSDLQSVEAELYALAFSHIPITDTLRHRLGLRGVALRVRNKAALDAKPQKLFIDIIMLAGQLGRFLVWIRDRGALGITLGFRYGCPLKPWRFGAAHTTGCSRYSLDIGRLVLMGARYLVTPKRILVIYAANTGQPSGRVHRDRRQERVLIVLDSLNRHLLGAYGGEEFDTLTSMPSLRTHSSSTNTR